MNTDSTRRRQFLTDILGAGLGVFSQTAVPGKTKATADENGFVSLFNGENLQGWHTNVQKVLHGPGGMEGRRRGLMEPNADGGISASSFCNQSQIPGRSLNYTEWQPSWVGVG